MTPDETKMQEKKIKLMKTAMICGLFAFGMLIGYLQMILSAIKSCTQ